MENIFKIIIQSRKAFIELIDRLSIEQLNEIPAGYNNNIIWNFGHIVVATQGLCYLRTGITTDGSFIQFGAAYTKGSKPTYFVSNDEVQVLKKLAITTIAQIESDYHAGVFKEIKPYSTATYGETMHTIEEVLSTTLAHDNLHFGYALAQNRAINNIIK